MLKYQIMKVKLSLLLN